jgi:hypothetical protein
MAGVSSGSVTSPNIIFLCYVKPLIYVKSV